MKRFVLRKQRTRAHVIADQSINHVERFIIDEGHAAERLEKDYGYDLFLFTYDKEGYAEPGLVSLQVKASDTLPVVGSDYVFDVDIRDYNRWMLERWPVIVILFDASLRRAYWLPIQLYFGEDAARRPKKGAKTVRVRLGKGQALNRRAIAKMRGLNLQAGLLAVGEET
jgi:Domain of unknown function (DUF4365)